MSFLLALVLAGGGLTGTSAAYPVGGSGGVSGTVSVNILDAGTLPVAVTNFPASQPVTGPATDTQLRASPLPISGTVTANAGTGTLAVSAADLPLPSGASTESTLALIKAKTDNLDVALSTRTKAADQQHVIVDSAPTTAVTGTFFQATQPVSGTVTASGPVTDTQLRASPVPVSGTFFQATQPVSLASAPTTAVTGTFWQTTQPVSLASAPTTPVTGTFWQATQPVSGTFFQATQPVSIASMPSTPVTGTFWQTTQPVSGTVTASGPVTDTQLRASAVPVSLTSTTVTGSVAVTGPLTDTQLRATAVPVSGTVTASGPVTDTQLRATPVPVSGTVATGGLTDTQLRASAVPVSGTVTASGPVTDTQLRATPVPVSGTVTATGPLTDTQLRATAVPVSLASTTITGTAAVTQSGTWSDRIVGNAGAAFDAVNNASAPANVVVAGYQLQSGATATAGTTGQVGSPVASLDHVPYARLGGPVTWACSLDAIGATLTQCQAAGGSGLKYYVTDIEIESATATAGLFLVRTGTGTNCGTGTASLLPSAATVPRLSYPANTAANPSVFHFLTPLATPAASEICIICTATNTCTVQMSGFTAP